MRPKPLRASKPGCSRSNALIKGSPLFQVEASGAEIKPTFRHSATINARIPFKWSWQKASPIAGFAGDDRAEILGQIKALHTAFAEKDESEIVRLLPLKGEIAKSLYLDEALFKEEGQKLIQAGERQDEKNYFGLLVARIIFMKLKGAWVAFDLMM